MSSIEGRHRDWRLSLTTTPVLLPCSALQRITAHHSVSHRIASPFSPFSSSSPAILRPFVWQEEKEKTKYCICMLVSDGLFTSGVLRTRADLCSGCKQSAIQSPTGSSNSAAALRPSPNPLSRLYIACTSMAGWRRTNFARWGLEAGLRTP